MRMRWYSCGINSFLFNREYVIWHKDVAIFHGHLTMRFSMWDISGYLISRIGISLFHGVLFHQGQFGVRTRKL
jgi:hypothetical protein